MENPKKPAQETEPLILYTDGACSGNPGPGAWAAILVDEDRYQVFWGAYDNTTNNRMELMGPLGVLEYLQEGLDVAVHSDSSYLVRAFHERWLDKWQRNNWVNSTKQPVKNRDLWERILQESRRHRLTFVKVKGHADSTLNNFVDQTAVQAIDDLRSQLIKEGVTYTAMGMMDSLPKIGQDLAYEEARDQGLFVALSSKSSRSDPSPSDLTRPFPFESTLAPSSADSSGSASSISASATPHSSLEESRSAHLQIPLLSLEEAKALLADNPDQPAFTERTTQEKQIFQGRVFSIEVNDIALPDGRPSIREVVRHPGGACVLPYDAETDTIYMVRQYRYPFGKLLWEVPAGKLETGEDPLVCARRELEEECGIQAKSWTKLLTTYPSPGYCAEILTIYLALSLTYGDRHLDPGEFLGVGAFHRKTVFEMIRQGLIVDGKTLQALLAFQAMGLYRKDRQARINPDRKER